jgi:MFS superfamily sulfate permease-like transporter
MNNEFRSFVLGVLIGIVISIVFVIASETPEDRHARRMEEIKEFAAMAPLAAMIYKAQNGN